MRDKNENEIKSKIQMFLVFSDNETPAKRKSCLYGIAVIIITLYQKVRSQNVESISTQKAMNYLPMLKESLLKSFRDKDAKVQNAGFDTLFNIIKICKEAFLFDEPLFKEFFDAICTSIADQLSESKEWAKKCNELLRDVVYVACQNYNNFDLNMFIQFITDKFVNAKNNDFVVTMLRWIELIHSINNIPILNMMPDILPRLLQNLNTKPTQSNKSEAGHQRDISKKSQEQLMRFLNEFHNKDYRTLYLENQIIDTLLAHLLRKNPDQSQNQHELSKLEALIWLREFLIFFQKDFHEIAQEQEESQQRKFNEMVLKQEKQDQEHANQNHQLVTLESMNSEFQQEFSQNEDPMIMPPIDDNVNLDYLDAKSIVENNFERQYPAIIKVIVKYANIVKGDYLRVVEMINSTLLSLLIQTMDSKDEFQYIFNELKRQFRDSKTTKTKDIILDWFIELFKEFQEDIIEFYNDIFDELISSLNFQEQNIVNKVLELLSMLSKSNEKYLRKTIKKLIEKIHSMGDRNQFIVGQVIQVLCQSINDERVFLEFGRVLRDYQNDLYFIEEMIDFLTYTIAGDQYHESFRLKLRGKKPTECLASKEKLFNALLKTWSYNSVSTISLCLITRNYELAYYIIFRFTQIQIDKDKLVQFSKLVQLLESPTLAYLRIELMSNTLQQKYLIKTLQGILMILPICKSFYCLKTRIECVKFSKLDPPLKQSTIDQQFFGQPYEFNDQFKMDDILRQFDQKVIIMKDFYEKRDKLREEIFKLEKQKLKEQSLRAMQQNPQAPNDGLTKRISAAYSYVIPVNQKLPPK
ncbi:vac14p [Stylonychia lemnae]|uniref:Vac14p n=1 Tax=Stylonychia lemnae TaxID=5949 RepID=A0A078ARD3_STYLE|nr:vac14p [Stylonychia lemnae]|eukprot:CDW85005.1 vac14p [Stylonychia lemnae]